MTMQRVVLFCRSKTRENYDAQISYFGLILIFCKYLHYFVPGYHEHSCHLYVNCAFYLDKIWYFYVNNRKLRHFKVYHLYFTSRYQLSPCGRAVLFFLPNNSFSLPETHGSSPTAAVETILLFIMHGCISIHQISNSPNFSPLNNHSRGLAERGQEEEQENEQN